MKKSRFLLIFILFLNITLFGQRSEKAFISKQDSVELYNRIMLLESSKENIKKDVLNKFIEYKNELDRSLTPIYITATVLAFFLSIGLIGYYKKIKNYINKKINKKISNIINDEQEKIVNLIRSFEREAVLKANKNILLLSKNLNDNNQIVKFFSKLDFKNVKKITLNNFKNVKKNNLIKKSDVIIINNINNSISDNDLLFLLNSFSEYKNSFVYYGTFNKKLAGKKNVNFANSEYTLYSRIIETLKIQDILSKK